MKPDKFKQPNPGMQLQALRASLEGHLTNRDDGVITEERLAAHVANHLGDLKLLLDHGHGWQWVE